MRRPPSTPMYWPVVKEDLSEQSHRTASDTSLGVPNRPRGLKSPRAFIEFWFAESAVGHVSLDHRRTDGVHADTLRGTFGSGRLSQSQDAMLAGDVDTRAWRANQSRNGRHVD